jgi:hypothetical protein
MLLRAELRSRRIAQAPVRMPRFGEEAGATIRGY